MTRRCLVLAALAAACAAPDMRERYRTVHDRPPEPPSPGAATAPVPAGPLELSIEDAVLLALRNHRDLRVQQLDPVLAGTFEKIERGVFDPEWFAGFELFREKASEVSRSTGDQFNVEGRETDFEGGVRQRFPTGTTVEATVEHGRETSNRTPEQQTARIGLTVTQALLRGLGPAVNLARVRQAELEALASRHELRRFTEVLLAETKVAYWNHVLAVREIEIFEQSLAVAEQQRREVEERIAVGVLPETEAAAARAEVARRRQALIDATSLLEERRLRLLRQVSPEGGLARAVRATSSIDIEPEPIGDVDDRVALAVRSRPDLLEARLRVEQNRLEAVVTRNGLLPKLDVFVSFARTGFDDSFTGSFRGLGDGTYDASVGLSLSHLAGNRAARARDEAAWVSGRQAERAVENLEQLVRLDVRLAANEAERARQQIAATRAPRELQEAALQAEKERFDVGTSTALLVAQAQRDLLASRIAEAEAVVAYRVALVRLHLAEGTLLERHGIVLDDAPEAR